MNSLKFFSAISALVVLFVMTAGVINPSLMPGCRKTAAGPIICPYK